MITLSIIAGFFLKGKLSIGLKRKISERFFVSLSGLSALFIILFIIYLLLHIFLLGKSHLTWEFLFTAPKDGLTGGGIFPALVGTSLLVLIMSLIGVPIGTITAIYLAEYAKENSILTKSIRFAVNTLAGVPAIVFGLFGLGFFIGFVGKQMDNVELNKRMNNLETVFNAPSSPFKNSGSATDNDIKKYLTDNDSKYWVNQIDQVKILTEMFGSGIEIKKAEVIKFFKDRSRPKWAQPALIWAALTMALLTLPVVIVSVEEAIRTIPREQREASLALGATKFTTIMKIVVPGAMSGVLTGTILTISRGAGEVAPILFTGVAYYLPDLPNTFYSQFMHLGYHIYVLTTQSTNVELTKPLQYATTLVLLMLTFLLNFTAVFIRSRIRSRAAKNS
jgi:ABC-type phosphate transport system permease subunit